jgi:hypothetical protein
MAYPETGHYRVMRDFLSSPERYFKHLFLANSDEESDALQRVGADEALQG